MVCFTLENRENAYPTDLPNILTWHFNSANHSLSDMEVCAISQISGDNNSHKRKEKRLIFKIGTIHPHGPNERFSFA